PGPAGNARRRADGAHGRNDVVPPHGGLRLELSDGEGEAARSGPGSPVNRRRAALLLLLVAAGCNDRDPASMTAEQVAAELADIRIEPGLWELTSAVVDVRAPDLPREIRNRMIGPRSRIRHCISPAQAEQPSANFLAMRADSACIYRD